MRTLTHSPAEVVAKLLIDLGLGVDPTLTNPPAWSVYSTAEPDAPDRCITVRDTVGRTRPRVMDGELQDTFGILVRVRSDRHGTGWVKADAIRANLAQSVTLREVTVSGSRYLVYALVGIGPVLPLGSEVPNSKRKVFTVNVEAVLRQTA